MKRCNFFFLVMLTILCVAGYAQPITGVWKGKVNNKRVEVKFVQKGDSITGTSYYPGLIKGHTRYTIKGYFDHNSNSIVWWDDIQLYPQVNSSNDRPFFSADYNCPGGGRMFLNSDPLKKDDPKVSLTKVERTGFPDEWDFVIDNYQFGANDPYIIDSIAMVAFTPTPEIIKAQPVMAKQTETKPTPAQPTNPPLVFLDRKEVEKAKPKEDKPVTSKPAESKPLPVLPPPPPAVPVAKEIPQVKKEEPVAAIAPPTNEDKFRTRDKVFALEIPVSGDSIELRFYDNAEVDGDSISLFLNNKMLFEHIRLTSYAYTIKLSVKDLDQSNELVMVAENLGSIPPNTSYMVVLVGEKRYEGQIESTESTSALIRLKKE